MKRACFTLSENFSQIPAASKNDPVLFGTLLLATTIATLVVSAIWFA